MTYTVYIPDAERGPTSYTQRQFATLKELTRWAVAAALDEPVAPPARAPEIVQILADIEAATAPKKFVKKLPDIKGATGKVVVSDSVIFPAGVDCPWLPMDTAEKDDIMKEDPTFKTRSEVDRSLRIDRHLSLAPEPEEEEKSWAVDTDEWFTDASASEWATPLRERNWNTVAEMYFAEIKQLFSTEAANNHADCLSLEDQEWFGGIAARYPALFAENLFPETQVRWDLLPAEFGEVCMRRLKGEKRVRGATAIHQFAKDAFTLLKFLRTGQRHSSWKDISLESEEGLVWGGAAAPATTEKLLAQWWSGTKPTDTVREFVMRAVVMRYFRQSGTASTVGSQEFLTTYMERVRKMGVDGVLPAGFLDWATRGTSFKHCKAALSFMGIASVRRADGQKYTNLSEVKTDNGEIWIFEDDLLDIVSLGFASFNEWQMCGAGEMVAYQ